jgi:hypothetical protein
MSGLVEDAIGMAESVVAELRPFGYRLDFKPSSLLELERIFEDHAENGGAKRGGFFDEHFGPRVFALGAYLGEVIRRNAGGTWHPKDGEPDNEIELEFHTANQYICWPIQRVIKRVKKGSEENVVSYAVRAGVDREAIFRKSEWWRFWGGKLA